MITTLGQDQSVAFLLKQARACEMLYNPELFAV